MGSFSFPKNITTANGFHQEQPNIQTTATTATSGSPVVSELTIEQFSEIKLPAVESSITKHHRNQYMKVPMVLYSR